MKLREELEKKLKELKMKRDKLNTENVAIKILLNSMYGIMAVPYSRYFKLDVAEAITSCGRHSIKMGEQYVNEILNNPNEELKKIMDELK